MFDPIYSAENCAAAYQLDWSYSVFWHNSPSDFSWLEKLQERTEPDGIRILQHQFDPPNVSKFLVSSKPHVSPRLIAQRVKGRLQHLTRDRMPNAFRRNYGLRSIGSTRREKLERYLGAQLDHHPMPDARVQERLKEYQIHCPEVDLSQPRRTSHALYWFNLHVVIVNNWRYIEIRHEVLLKLREMILKASRAKQYDLSRAAIVPDHIHLTLSCELEESPQDVAMGYMNNLAYACGMKRVFKFSYYVGTFSEYDLGVIPGM